MSAMNFNYNCFQIVKTLSVAFTLILILSASIGQIVRDRTVFLALLMYIPLLPLGLWAILLDLWQAGRGVPQMRFSLTLIGVGACIWGSLLMLGTAQSPVNQINNPTIHLLHWNVRWGNDWSALCRTIIQYPADILILSEPPQNDIKIKFLLQQLGPNWSFIRHQDKAAEPLITDEPLKRMTDPRNKLVIAAPWPVQYQRALNIRNAVTMLITLKHPDFPLNLLAVDGERNLQQLRTPMLTDIAQIVSHHSVDVIVGDFNAISRSLGFEAFSTNYQLVSQAFWGWRGTWPTFLPLYDLDHIWIHQCFQLIKLDFLTHLATDHRGQRIQFSRLVRR